jgi:[ribosomal protein S18]-alanine N-acetyltransferase
MTNETTFSLRPATAEDLDAIVSVEQKFYPAPWTKAQFAEELEKPFSTFWVLTDDESDETVAAYCIFWSLDDSVELLNITVDLPFRSQGFAKRLLQHLFQYGLKEEKNTVFLEVRKSNLAAIQLYQKFGFEVVQVRKRFYADGEDAYQMKCALESDTSEEETRTFWDDEHARAVAEDYGEDE